MPPLKFKKVVSCSSESDENPASNLLQERKKFTARAGELKTEAVLEFETPVSSFSSLNIGNEHSHSVVVEVGADEGGQFQALLKETELMSERDSRNSERPNQVKCFTKAELEGLESGKEWRFLRVTCNQPFNKRVPFGLSFLSITGSVVKKKSPESTFVLIRTKDLPTKSPFKMLGRFKIREDSPEDEEAKGSSLMERWKQKRNEFLTPPKEKDKLLDRNRASLFEGTDDADNDRIRKSAKRLELDREKTKKAEQEKEKSRKAEKEETREKPRPRIKTFSEFLSPEKAKDDLDVTSGSSSSKRRSSITSNSGSKKPKHSDSPSTSKEARPKSPKNQHHTPRSQSEREPKPRTSETRSSEKKAPKKEESPASASTQKKPVQRKPFNQLLKGVTFVISGIANPERAEIRSKAIEMGAWYSADWTDRSSHLICAFMNTPKYREVKGKGKIVTKDWVLDGHHFRKRFPWRRYALDPKDKSRNESEDEVEEEISRENLQKKLSLYSLDFIDDEPKKNGNEDPYSQSTDEETSNPEKPLIFAGRSFFLHPNLKDTDVIKIQNQIPDNGGQIVTDLHGADFILSEKSLEGVTGEVVKVRWVFECLEMECFIPTKRYKF